AAAWIERLELGPHLGSEAVELWQARKAHDGCRADQVERRAHHVAGKGHDRVARGRVVHDTGGVRAQAIHDRVVLLLPGDLGDFLLALPALRLVRAHHFGAHVTAVVSESLRPLVALTGVADATASLDGAEVAWLFGGARRPPWLTPRSLVYSWLG